MKELHHTVKVLHEVLAKYCIAYSGDTGGSGTFSTYDSGQFNSTHPPDEHL
jgi:hypothetical protein